MGRVNLELGRVNVVLRRVNIVLGRVNIELGRVNLVLERDTFSNVFLCHAKYKRKEKETCIELFATRTC